VQIAPVDHVTYKIHVTVIYFRLHAVFSLLLQLFSTGDTWAGWSIVCQRYNQNGALMRSIITRLQCITQFVTCLAHLHRHSSQDVPILHSCTHTHSFDFLACDVFVITNHRAIAMMFVRLSRTGVHCDHTV